MAGFLCPYCSMMMPVSPDTCATHTPSFENANGTVWNNGFPCKSPSQTTITFYKCPNCGQYTIMVEGSGMAVSDLNATYIRPSSCAKIFPSYIPVGIRQDYEEACAIVDISPKASATLSRRCLQSMIRDFWKITGKKRLIDEIDALEEKVPAAQWKVLNSLRRIGNIGAHPEADVNQIIDIEPSDAQKLVSIIELLIKQWYIERHEQEQLYADILALDEGTKAQKSKE